MTDPQPLCIGLSLAATWLSRNGWRRPDSHVEDLFTAQFYADVARRAEAARLDFVFRPDTLTLDVQATAREPGFSSLDPSLLLAAFAGATSRIGLVSTASTSFVPPYVIARQLMSLHWISGGRAGWNVVTSLDGQRNFGLDQMPPADERYALAQEAVDVIRALWASYPHEALRFDRAAGRFADPEQILAINHEGARLSVQGPLNLPAHDAGTPPLFQAGASEVGLDFAAANADAIFAASPDVEAGRKLREDLRRRATQAGRPAGAVKVLPGLSLYLAQNREDARTLYADTQAGLDQARQYRNLWDNLGLDLTGLPLDQRITGQMLPPPPAQPRSRTHAALIRRLIERDEPRITDLLASPEVAGSAHWLVVGTVEDAVRQIVEWQDAGAMDGFIALPGGSPESLSLVLDEVVPALRELGRFRRDYAGQSLRDHLNEGQADV